MSNKSDFAEIIEDMDTNELDKKKNILQKYYDINPDIFEIGVDEVGRGPLFGRVYTAAVILSKDNSFDHSKMKDSKLFHSKKKIAEVAEYIKKNAIAWSITFEDEKVIDEINILQATQKSMHKSILNTIQINYLNHRKKENYHLLVDGNYFKPITMNPQYANTCNTTCIEKGDNKFTAIAAASILAKVERDKYIHELCKENPELAEKYGIDTNKGYGSKKHIDGIKQNGITVWHRRSFGICKEFV
jgi:ribonuclease HII